MKGILSKTDAIEAAIKAGVPSKRMRLMQAHDPKLDEGVLMWLKQARGQNLPVSGDLIKEKAMKLAKLMHIPDFMASDGWREMLRSEEQVGSKEDEVTFEEEIVPFEEAQRAWSREAGSPV